MRIGGIAAMVCGFGVIAYVASGAGTEPAVRNEPGFVVAAIAFAVWGLAIVGAGAGVLLGVRLARPVAGVLAGLAALMFALGMSDVATGIAVFAGIVAILAVGYGRYLAD